MSTRVPEPDRREARPAPRNRTDRKRLSLEKKDDRCERGGGDVVKGVSKRIIVVDSPDPRIFEKAIFIVREESAGQTGVSESELLRQARQAAGGALRPGEKEPGRLLPALRGALFAVAGAAATALAWIMVQMTHL